MLLKVRLFFFKETIVLPLWFTWKQNSQKLIKFCFICLQDSAAVQILLEICLPTEEEKAKGVNSDSLLRNVQSVITTSASNKGIEEGEDNLLCNLREVQCLICCLLHQMYIADPNIAKLVHFQVCFKECCSYGRHWFLGGGSALITKLMGIS